MGEAQRRRAAGHASEQTGATDRRVPAGELAITLDVAGCDPSTLVTGAGEVADLMASVGRHLRRVPYAAVVQGIAADFRRVRGRDEAACRAVGTAALWSALNHPTMGNLMRRRISDALRKDGRAHISWCFGPDGLAMAVGGRFHDLRDFAARHAGSGGVTAVFHRPTDDGTEPMQ